MAAERRSMAAPGRPVASVLLVDDDPSKLVALESILEPLGQNLVRATSGRDALRRVLAEDFAVILLDVRMAGMDGFETAELIRQRQRSERTPIIFVTAYGAGEVGLERGYRLGAVDFISAPLVPEILRAKVSVFVDLHLKTEEIRQQEERLRLLEQRDHRRRLERAELRRLHAERRFASILAVAEDAIIALDGDRRVVLFNHGAERVFGRTAAETVGQPIDLLLPDGVDQITTPGTTAGPDRRSPDAEGHHEVRARRRDGAIFPAEMTVAEFPEEGRTITAVILRDISEHKAAEAEVRRLNQVLEHRLSAGVDLVAHLAASLDPSEVLARVLVRASAAVKADEGMLLRVEDGGLRLADRHSGAGGGHAQPRGELERHPLIRRAIDERVPVVVGGDDRGSAGEGQHVSVGDGLHTAVLPLVVDDRVRAVLVLSRHGDDPFTSGDAEMLVLIGNVATVALRNAQLFDEAQQASVAKSEFLRMAAHELRTPTGVLRGYLSMLRDGTLGPCPQGWERPLGVVDGKAAELTGLIDDLLLAASMEGGSVPVSPEVFDLRDAVRATVRRAEGRAALLGARLEQVVPEEPVAVEADPDHVARILDNLVNNALTYSATPPWVCLSVTGGEAPAVRVEDHGVGVPPELAQRVFERFYRVNDPVLGYPPGTGLGLYISRDLAHRAGGRLLLEHSRPGQGSCFCLTLRSPLSSVRIGDDAPRSAAAGGSSRSVN
jgi:PAS domain S-box-containing protein